jgi:hypothetical protein
MLTITITGQSAIPKTVEFITEHPRRYGRVFLDETAYEAVQLMRKNVPKGTRNIGLNESVVSYVSDVNERTITFVDPTQQAIAAFNEYGVRPHFRNIYKDRELYEWASVKIPNFIASGRRSLLIGGPNSNMQRGNSRNKFIDKTIEELETRIPEISRRVEEKMANKNR